jgi:hypothetical protein
MESKKNITGAVFNTPSRWTPDLVSDNEETFSTSLLKVKVTPSLVKFEGFRQPPKIPKSFIIKKNYNNNSRNRKTCVLPVNSPQLPKNLFPAVEKTTKFAKKINLNKRKTLKINKSTSQLVMNIKSILLSHFYLPRIQNNQFRDFEYTNLNIKHL